LSIALTAVGNMVERRVAHLLNSAASAGLPRFLAADPTQPTLGFMALQHSAAALAAENRALSTPASVQTIPANVDSEDLASMGVLAAEKALRILANVEFLVAIELLCAAQGVELKGTGGMGKGTAVAFKVVRSIVPFLPADLPLQPHVDRLARSVHSGTIVAKVEETVSQLE